MSEFKIITLYRSTCFGTCPSYKLIISSDGIVRYEGLDYVKIKGKRKWKLNTEQIEKLNKELIRSRYFTMVAKRPKSFYTCASSCTTSVLLEDGTFRALENEYGWISFPKWLSVFENAIDEISGVQKYIGDRG